MLKFWDIFLLRGGIDTSVWSTKTFLDDIKEQRYKQINKGYQNSKFETLDNLVSWNLMSHIVLFMFGIPYVVPKWVWTGNMPKEVTFKLFMAKEVMHKLRWYKISKYLFVHYFKFLKSNAPYFFLLISQLPDIIQKCFVFQMELYESHLSNEICPSLLACL